MQGVVLQTYGAGNAPDNRPDLLTVLKEASDIGVIIVNITQCTRGCVSTSYAAGKVNVLSINRTSFHDSCTYFPPLRYILTKTFVDVFWLIFLILNIFRLWKMLVLSVVGI